MFAAVLRHGNVQITCIHIVIGITDFSVFMLVVDAIRIIKAGGVYLNHVRVTQPDSLLTFGQEILPNYITLLRIGKYLTRVHNFVSHD